MKITRFLIIVLALLVLLPNFAVAQTYNEVHQLRLSADQFYGRNNFQEAELDYRRALVKEPDQMEVQYNLGNALFLQDKAREAQPFWETAAQNKDPQVAAKAQHNLGNMFYAQQKFEKAIQSYQAALREVPDDLATKKNLAMAQRKLKEKQQQQQQQDPSDRPQQPQQEGETPPKDQKNTDQNQKPSAAALSKEEAKRALQLMDEHDRDAKKRLQRNSQKGEFPKGNDW